MQQLLTAYGSRLAQLQAHFESMSPKQVNAIVRCMWHMMLELMRPPSALGPVMRDRFFRLSAQLATYAGDSWRVPGYGYKLECLCR